MADNYLENKMEAYRLRKEKEKRAKTLAWRKRMEIYKKKLAEEKKAAEASVTDVTK